MMSAFLQCMFYCIVNLQQAYTRFVSYSSATFMSTIIGPYKLKFDDKDPVLGSKYGELKYIIDLICNEHVEFNLRVDYGLHSDIRDFFENILH